MAANTLLPGDTVIVREGSYPERVTTSRGGTNEVSRITFSADEQVTLRGWIINHAYITVRGFDITGHSPVSETDAHVKVNTGGDHFQLLDCTVRDAVQIIRQDMMFHAGSNVITSATGGFLGAGFVPGHTIWVGAAAIRLTITNAGEHTITEVTDQAISVASSLVDQGPLPIYLSAGYGYGLHFHGGAENAYIHGNTFTNLGFDAWWINGQGHRIDSNCVVRVNGWDAMHFMGTNHLFTRNFIGDSPTGIYQPSPDALENYGATRYRDVVFSNNWVQDFEGVLAYQKSSGNSSNLVWTRNVFHRVSGASITHPYTIITNNTFLSVALIPYPMVEPIRHPVVFSASASNSVLRNNAFINCGRPASSIPAETIGWYILGNPATILATNNFVCGAPPNYPLKTLWPEDPALNGGDPGFVNIDDPLGPDGLPFTEDDGLRLLPTSKLLKAGDEKQTIGAYDLPGGGPPRLEAQIPTAHEIQLMWPQTLETWMLQSGPSPVGPWTNSPATPTLESGQFYVVLGAENPVGYFRLIR